MRAMTFHYMDGYVVSVTRESNFKAEISNAIILHLISSINRTIVASFVDFITEESKMI